MRMEGERESDDGADSIVAMSSVEPFFLGDELLWERRLPCGETDPDRMAGGQITVQSGSPTLDRDRDTRSGRLISFNLKLIQISTTHKSVLQL